MVLKNDMNVTLNRTIVQGNCTDVISEVTKTWEKLIKVNLELETFFPQVLSRLQTDFLGTPFLAFASPSGRDARLYYQQGLWYPNMIRAGTASLEVAFKVAISDAERNDPFSQVSVPLEGLGSYEYKN